MPPTFADLTAAALYGGFLVFARVAAAFMLLPGFGETHLPPRVRLVAALLVAAAMAANVPGRPALVPPPATMAGQLGAEIVVGLLLGTVARTMFNALHVAGTVMAQQAGLGLIIPASIEPEGVSALAQFLLFGAISLIFALGLDLQLLLAIRDSYTLFPLGELPDPGGMALHVTRTLSTAFSLGIRLSLPFLLIGFTLYAGLGVINRAMPQMMVFFVAAPGFTIVGLVLLAATLPMLLWAWAGAFDAALFGD
ncbi:MAG TPA: flagellar biosynthetic protein FliR [Geminicoccaceae bacterium]|nr:flagellar biosynthetic protein FliR [Geminicoccaceae bacterium]